MRVQYGVPWLIARFAIVAGFGGAVVFGLFAVFPGGPDEILISLAITCAVVALASAAYMITTFSAARRADRRRPEDAGGE
jgi:hypothetical protein